MEKGLGAARSQRSVRISKNGWGGRDRTYECRNQNPVPYHLATPQWSFSADDVTCRANVRLGFSDDYANALNGWRASVRTTRPSISCGKCRNACRASLAFENAANTQPPE